MLVHQTLVLSDKKEKKDVLERRGGKARLGYAVCVCGGTRPSSSSVWLPQVKGGWGSRRGGRGS